MADEEKSLPESSTADATRWAETKRAEKHADSYPAEIIPMESELEKELGHLLNRHSAENESGTPDFLLAMFLKAQLDLFNQTINQRAVWRGESVELPSLQKLHQDTETMDKIIAILRSKVEEGVIHIVEPLEATDLYREVMDYRPPQDLEQGGFEAGDTQGPDTVIAPGALDANDGKEVPLVTYSGGQRNEIGTVTLHVTPGEALVTGTINGANAMFADPDASYSISVGSDEAAFVPPLDEPKDDIKPDAPATGPEGRFARYQKRGLSS